MNKIVLIGNLTRDTELSTTSSGINVCRFSIAVGRRFANQDGEREADFFNIVAWRSLADICNKYLKKGNKVCVTGSVQARQYDGKDGERKTVVEVIAEDVEFLTPKNSGGEYEEPAQSTAAPKKKKAATIADLEQFDDDGSLPF